MIHIWRPWKLSSFQEPHLPYPSTSKTLPSPWPWTSSFKQTPIPLQMITNQLEEHIIQGWLLYVVRSWFPFFTSFHLAEASPSAFSSLYTLVCAVVQKYHKMYFIYNYSHFWYSFCNQSVLLAQLENVSKLWNNNHAQRNQNKNKTKHSNWPRVVLFDSAHKQCNGITKGWLHCLTSESKGRFLVNKMNRKVKYVLLLLLQLILFVR